MAELTPLTGAQRRTHAVRGASSVPVWPAMILAPRSRLARRLTERPETLAAWAHDVTFEGLHGGSRP
jgi:hypothetical protein